MSRYVSILYILASGMLFTTKHLVMIIYILAIAIINIAAAVFFGAVYYKHTKADKKAIEEYRMRA